MNIGHKIKSLVDLKIGETAKVVGFISGAKLYRQKLLAMGVTPGAELVVLRKAPLGDPIEIKIRGYSLSLRKKECQCVTVSESSIA